MPLKKLTLTSDRTHASTMPSKAKRILAALRRSILPVLIACLAFGARAAVQVTQFNPPLQISAYADAPANSYFNVLGADLDANGEVDYRLAYGLGGISAFFNAPVRFGQQVSQLDFLGNVVTRSSIVGGIPLGSMIGTNIVSSITTNFYVWSPGFTNTDDLTQPFGDHEATVLTAGLVTYNLPGPVITISNGTLATNIIYPQPIVSGDIVGQDAVIALEFVVNGQTHYGYIHCDFSAGASGLIYGWAYETEADTAIQAVSLAPSPAPPTEIPGKGHSGIVGMIGGNSSGWTVSISSSNGTFLKSVKPDADGYFKVNLAPGTYVLTPLLVPHPGPGQPMPNFVASGTPKTVKVSRNHFAFVVLNTSLGLVPSASPK